MDSQATLEHHLEWRTATKRFDSTRKISDEDFEPLLEALRLAPSCYGLQPWKFVVIDDARILEQLQPLAWNQPQAGECSHLVVLCALRSIDASYVRKLCAKFAETRGIPVERVSGYERLVMRFIERLSAEELSDWMKNQVYVALGVVLAEAALRRIDTCPMEGFEADAVDRLLGLEEKGLRSTVLCAFGYRSSEDRYSQQPKVRFDASDVVLKIDRLDVHEAATRNRAAAAPRRASESHLLL